MSGASPVQPPAVGVCQSCCHLSAAAAKPSCTKCFYIMQLLKCVCVRPVKLMGAVWWRSTAAFCGIALITVLLLSAKKHKKGNDGFAASLFKTFVWF